MTYHYFFNPRSLRQLKKLDKLVQRLLIDWLDKHIENSDNPRLHGKGLTANHSGEWRYRVGNYRILVDIHEAVVEVEVIQVGHRREIYN